MAWTTREVVILGVLVLCMPAQYWLVSRLQDARGPQHALLRLGRQMKWLWFEALDCWKRWYLQTVASVRRALGGGRIREPELECPAREVVQYRERTGYFGLSPLERPQRPAYLSLRVGQVVKVLDPEFQGALGVIIAWDLYARAPESWLQNKYGADAELRREPHFRVLLARPLLREIYVAQRHLKVLRATQIHNPRVSDIFSHFDGAQYIPRAPLRQLYPLD